MKTIGFMESATSQETSSVAGTDDGSIEYNALLPDNINEPLFAKDTMIPALRQI